MISSPSKPTGVLTPDGQGGYSLTQNADPYWDDCATGASVAMSGTNIGDELNAAGISWGWAASRAAADSGLGSRCS